MSEQVERRKRAFLANRQKAYQSVFHKGTSAKEVLSDLAAFCRAENTCFDPDPRMHALLEGRREVYLRIKEHLEMNFEDLYLKLAKGEVKHGLAKRT